MNVKNYRTYRGCFHIHSAYSDGGGTVEEIMADANKCHLDFAVVTDHNTLAGLKEGKEGWYDDSLLLIGVEIALKAGHYLALNVPPDLKWVRGDVQGSIDNVNACGGFGIIAHPSSRWPWKDWSATGYAGVEIINLSSLFHLRRKTGQAKLILDIIKRLFRCCKTGMQTTMSVTSDGSIEKWTSLLPDRQVVGIGGTDAHALVDLGKIKLRIPTYAEIFRSMQLHVLVTEALNHDLDHDKALIYDAIREGRCYTAYAVWGDPMGFQFTASCHEKEAVMGQSIAMAGQPPLPLLAKEGITVLRVRVPGKHPVSCRIFRNQEMIHTTEDHKFECSVDARGAYRVEVFLRKKRREVPWVISNPIYIK